METIIYTLIALSIWELFLHRFCLWLLYQASRLHGKYWKEISYRLFQSYKLTPYDRSPAYDRYVETFWQMSFENRVNGEIKTINISIKIQGEKRVFKRVCRIEVDPKGYESDKYTVDITILAPNGEDKETVSLDITRENKKQLAREMYYIFVLYHKKWGKQQRSII